MESGAPLSARSTAIEVWEQAHPEWQPLVVEVSERDDLVATALLGYRMRTGWTEALLLGPQDEPGWIPALSSISAQRLARAIASALDRRGGPWLLRLANLPLRQTILQQFLAAFAHVRVSSTCQGVRLTLPPGAPLRAVTTHNTRSAVAKARNRILRDGRHLDFAWLSAAPDVQAVLADVLRIHRGRNLQVRGVSQLDDEATYAEFTGRVRAHANQGKVRLLVTRIDGEIGAFALCLLDQRTLHVYANLAAPQWLRYSVGAITNHAVVGWALANGEIDVLDWGLGVQRYKRSGPIALEPHISVEIYSSSGAETAVLAARATRSAVRALLARTTERSEWHR
jgi:CelD/BcsL family acetyltransferase involved in cellulose biosynthesis